MSEQGEGEDWVLVPLDKKMAQRQGMPFRVPVPKAEFEGLADAGLHVEKLVGWIKGFFETAPVGKDGNWRRRNSELVSQLEGFVDKQPLWKKAQELFAQNKFDDAIKTLKRITTMCPDDHAAKMNYANALANQRDYEKALKQLKQIKESFAGEPEYHVTLAQIYVATADNEAAIGELTSALEAKPDHLGAMDALAKLGVLVRMYESPKDAASLTYVRADSVLEYINELWGQEPRSVDYYLEQLAYHEGERRFEISLAAAERAAKESSEVVERAEVGRITALRELGRADEALAAASAFAEKAPRSAGAQVELAQCYAKKGQNTESWAAIDKALELDPGDAFALVLKFWPADRGDLMKVQNALPGLETWAEQHPTVPGAWRSLARAKLVVGADDQALELFGKAVSLAPADDDLRSEWWSELANKTRYQDIIDDSQKLGSMTDRDWRLRWNEAEAFRGLGRVMEARACYMQLNQDDRLMVDVRRRAKRAAMELGQGAPPGAPPPGG
jgi:tetratricopeptide (TPR) repeat protein